tara:strand:+ start:481 stop:876 length:396 start_codon:yes stop_codon:yes gene_type:complete
LIDKKIPITSEKTHKPFGEYSLAVLNKKTGLLVTSGQLGIDRVGKIPKTIGEQAKLCFNNINEILDEAKFNKTHILRVNAFLTNRENITEYMKVRDDFFLDIKIKPASTLLIVSGFNKPEFLVEIEVIAQK